MINRKKQNKCGEHTVRQRGFNMKSNNPYQIVAIDHFIEATRDSGYKNFGAAIAELVDNSIESGATLISINIEEGLSSKPGLVLTVQDNGSGMSPSTLRLALQFGGTTRFDSRNGIGRYGMGLPNSSLSQTRLLDVYSWTSPGTVWWSYLDVDKISSGEILEVPKPVRKVLPKVYRAQQGKSGTLVRWMKCDRVDYRTISSLVAGLHESLGQSFRIALSQGVSLSLNGERVRPVDPLFLAKGNNMHGAVLYGPLLTYEIQVPGQSRTSTVAVRFSELPIEKWQFLSNKEKRLHGISKRAGLSVLRAGREIDYGWFFMGDKRKENYDDWWRGEILFKPELDELFGVTHTKQGIQPTAGIISILSPEIEKIAHELNGRVRRRFTAGKRSSKLSSAEALATERDYLIEPPTGTNDEKGSLSFSSQLVIRDMDQGLPGFRYRIEAKPLRDVSFFVPIASDREFLIQINEQHPFYRHIYSLSAQDSLLDKEHLLRALQLLILSAARAECNVSTASGRRYASSLRHSWSNILAAFLG
jgi:hypothetical protein